MFTNDKIEMKNRSTLAQEHFFGIVIVIAFLLPHTNTFFQLVNPILCILMVCIGKKRKWNSNVLLVLVPIVISLLLNIQVISQKALLSTATIFLYFLCFPFVGRFTTKNLYLYICCGYIVVSQLVYLLGIPVLENFFDTVYPISEDDLNRLENMQNTITYDDILEYRLGGLFHNSNDCARALTILLAFFYVLNQGERNRSLLLFSSIVYAAILLTGSRTGFVISTLIIYFGFLRQHRYAGTAKYLFIALSIIGIGYILSTGTSFRGLDIESGMHNSANLKWNTFTYYLKTESSVLSFLFGHIDPSLFKGHYGVAMNKFDSEYGTLTYRFGIVGYCCILLFYWKTIKSIDKSKWFFFIVLLWMISSTIIAAFRACFIFMLFMSVVYSNYKAVNYKREK